METWQKGEIAVLEVIKRAIEKGYTPNRPVVEGTRYDLILERNGSMYRVQVKYVDGKWSKTAGASVCGLTKRNRNSKSVRTYQTNEIDALIAFLPQTGKLCWFDANVIEGKSSLTIRHEPAKNKQSKNCYHSWDYEW